jgi:hypothetical protein
MTPDEYLIGPSFGGGHHPLFELEQDPGILDTLARLREP